MDKAARSRAPGDDEGPEVRTHRQARDRHEKGDAGRLTAKKGAKNLEKRVRRRKTPSREGPGGRDAVSSHRGPTFHPRPRAPRNRQTALIATR